MLKNGDTLVSKTTASIISCDVILSEREQNYIFLYCGTVASIKNCWIKLKDSYIKKKQTNKLTNQTQSISVLNEIFNIF